MSRFGKPENTTEHHYYEQRLSAYLDGELLPQERDAVERHLTTCQTCQWDIETLTKTVQWTRELPTVPVPRVFTIQVPAAPQRAAQQRWRLVPALQAATALVAFLLFFTVAGDFMLGGFQMGRAPQPMLLEQQALDAVEATQAPEEPAREALPSLAVVVETVVVEKEVETEVQAEKVVAEATLAPMPTEASVAAAAEEAEAPVAEGIGGVEGDEPMPAEAPGERGTGEAQAEELPLSATLPPTGDLETASGAGGEPEPMMLTVPTDAPAQPTELAAAQEARPVEAGDWTRARAVRQPGVFWLRIAEFALAVVLVLLATMTFAFMVQRRRSR